MPSLVMSTVCRRWTALFQYSSTQIPANFGRHRRSHSVPVATVTTNTCLRCGFRPAKSTTCTKALCIPFGDFSLCLCSSSYIFVQYVIPTLLLWNRQFSLEPFQKQLDEWEKGRFVEHEEFCCFLLMSLGFFLKGSWWFSASDWRHEEAPFKAFCPE